MFLLDLLAASSSISNENSTLFFDHRHGWDRSYGHVLGEVVDLMVGIRVVVENRTYLTTVGDKIIYDHYWKKYGKSE